jgi:hypothetical protein
MKLPLAKVEDTRERPRLTMSASCGPLDRRGCSPTDRARTPHLDGTETRWSTLFRRLTPALQTAQLLESLGDPDLRVERQGALPILLREVRIRRLKQLARHTQGARRVARVAAEPVRGAEAGSDESLAAIAIDARGDLLLDEGEDLEAVAGLERPLP